MYVNISTFEVLIQKYVWTEMPKCVASMSRGNDVMSHDCVTGAMTIHKTKLQIHTCV